MDKDVWVLMPTVMKGHVPAQLSKWTGRGYRVGLWVDSVPNSEVHQFSELKIQGPYPGVWASWNILAHTACKLGADVCVLIGDDMDPDPTKNAQEIANEFFDKFPDGFGVMQPCGDLQGKDSTGTPAAARICGSPWVGRSWVQFAYGGSGPVSALYDAFYADEELKHYAEKMGRLWMRPDLSQFHRHWSWGHLPKRSYHERNQTKWLNDKALFERRQKAGFP